MKGRWVRELTKDDAIITWLQACELFNNKYHCPYFMWFYFFVVMWLLMQIQQIQVTDSVWLPWYWHSVASHPVTIKQSGSGLKTWSWVRRGYILDVNATLKPHPQTFSSVFTTIIPSNSVHYREHQWRGNKEERCRNEVTALQYTRTVGSSQYVQY